MWLSGESTFFSEIQSNSRHFIFSKAVVHGSGEHREGSFSVQIAPVHATMIVRDAASFSLFFLAVLGSKCLG